MDKTAKHSFPPCSLCWAGAAKSMKMHHFHNRQCTLITWEGVANQCNGTIMVEVPLSDSPIMICDTERGGKTTKAVKIHLHK